MKLYSKNQLHILGNQVRKKSDLSLKKSDLNQKNRFKSKNSDFFIVFKNHNFSNPVT